MPGPFPGFDPYLEDKRYWEVFHSRFAAAVMDNLNSGLPPDYVASAEQRLYIEESKRSIWPDASIISVSQPTLRPFGFASNGGGTAVAEEVGVEAATDTEWSIEFIPAETHQYYVEILAVGDEGRVIAVIEILSPSNKLAGTTGYAEYFKKQSEVLASDTHLVEIDLLRGGEPTVAAPPAELIRNGGCDRLVCLTPGRLQRGTRLTVWPISLRKKLPTIRIPLGIGEPPVPLDLQAVFAETYDRAAFAKRIDYSNPPSQPQSRDDEVWMNERLREHSARAAT